MPKGPKRLPLAELIKRGSRHAKGRAADVQAPAPEDRVMPVKPLWLSRAASQFWDTAIPKLLPLGVLNKADDDTLGRYCQFFVDWVLLGNRLRVEGHSLATEKGWAPNPESMAHARMAIQLAHLEEVLGLTPAGRLKLHLNILPPDKPKATGSAKPASVLGGEEFFNNRKQA